MTITCFLIFVVSFLSLFAFKVYNLSDIIKLHVDTGYSSNKTITLIQRTLVTKFCDDELDVAGNQKILYKCGNQSLQKVFTLL